MQPIPAELPNASAWAEVVRVLVTLLFTAGLAAVIVLAVKWFAGPRSRRFSCSSWCNAPSNRSLLPSPSR